MGTRGIKLAALLLSLLSAACAGATPALEGCTREERIQAAWEADLAVWSYELPQECFDLPDRYTFAFGGVSVFDATIGGETSFDDKEVRIFQPTIDGGPYIESNAIRHELFHALGFCAFGDSKEQRDAQYLHSDERVWRHDDGSPSFESLAEAEDVCAHPPPPCPWKGCPGK